MAHTIPSYMSPEYVTDKTSVDILWKQLQTLQDLAESYGIENIFQDNGAEILEQLVYLNMKAVPGREGNDGCDINGCEWEMKSIDISRGSSGVTTNHHLNAAILEKYETVPWSFAFYDRIDLQEIYIVSNNQLKDIFDEWREDLKHEKDKNNPKIPISEIKKKGFCIYRKGDQFPIDPMTKIDTTPYVTLQKKYKEKLQREQDITRNERIERTLSKKKDKYEKEITELKKKCKDLSKNLSSSPKELSSLKRSLMRKEATLASTKTKLKDAKKALIKSKKDYELSCKTFSKELANFRKNCK